MSGCAGSRRSTPAWVCWTWPAAQEQRLGAPAGPGRRRQRLLRVRDCRSARGYPERDDRSPA